MSFIFGILVLGALLTVIFGKQVGALFVTGSLTIVAVIIIIFLVMISPLIWGFFTSSSASSSSRSYSSFSYGTSYSSPASGNEYSPVTTPTSPISQAPATSPVYASSPQTMPTSNGPTIGIATQPVSAQFASQFSMSPGYGTQVVSVAPGSPAEQAGLVSSDFIQAMDSDAITENHTLADYEARRGVGYIIVLSVQHNDGSHWVHEWIKVVPR